MTRFMSLEKGSFDTHKPNIKAKNASEFRKRPGNIANLILRPELYTVSSISSKSHKLSWARFEMNFLNTISEEIDILTSFLLMICWRSIYRACANACPVDEVSTKHVQRSCWPADFRYLISYRYLKFKKLYLRNSSRIGLRSICWIFKKWICTCPVERVSTEPDWRQIS